MKNREEEIKRTTIELVINAGKILEKKFFKIKHIAKKLNAGIVTEADKLSESFIIKHLEKRYPTSSILSEEVGDIKKADEMKWIIDPLDGTTNFAHGFPWFNVTIALEENGIITFGVVYHPLTKYLFYAQKGKGAFWGKRRLKVSTTKDLRDSLLGTGFYYTTGEELHKEMGLYEAVQQNARGVRRAGAAALDLALVAAGRFDGFWERYLSPWDIAAGSLLIKEAGGQLSDYSGNNYSIYGKETVATNNRIHKPLLKIIQKRF